jgi:hypothetical protein
MEGSMMDNEVAVVVSMIVVSMIVTAAIRLRFSSAARVEDKQLA